MNILAYLLSDGDPYKNAPPVKISVRVLGIAKAVRVRTRSNGDI